MIPGIFVGSAYYDLKYTGERLKKLIESNGFEPILFENDNLTHQHGKAVYQSVYYEAEPYHLMVLIIGGRYGLPETLTNIEDEWKKYDEEYISIIRKEWETAVKKNIPILVFVDKNVYSDYQTYKENPVFFDILYSPASKETKENKKFKFAHVDHITIFKFIDLTKTGAVKLFEKIEEIETYIKLQIS